MEDGDAPPAMATPAGETVEEKAEEPDKTLAETPEETAEREAAELIAGLAGKAREKGNDAFRAGKFDDAITCYKEVGHDYAREADFTVRLSQLWMFLVARSKSASKPLV